MSALAARRAAQKAKTEQAPKITAPQVEVVIPIRSAPKATSPKPAKGKKGKAGAKAAAQRTPPAPTRSPTPPPEEFLVPSPSASPEPAPSKRRKVGRERYYPAAEVEEPTPKRSRRQRGFSPSAPQSDGEGSSGEGSDEEGEDESYDDIAGTGAATPWSRPASPGPSRSALRAGTSKFNPREGVNLLRVDEKTLAAAGVSVPGPGVVVSLGKEDELLIAGVFSITPLRQPLSLLSTTVHPACEEDEITAYPVFAPTSHPIPVLMAGGLEDVLLESPLLGRLSLPRSFGSASTVLLIQEHQSGIEGLRGDVVPGFNNIWVDDGSSPGAWGLRGVHPVLDTFSLPVYPHCTAPSWTTALDALAETQEETASDASPAPERVPVVLVKGPKRSGKSSLARAALNRLLASYERVAWLECDMGQGEFGCGGVVGLWILDAPLLGPSFTHPRLPERAHFLGELSPQSCPDEYMEAIYQLITHYQYEVQHPLAPASARRRSDAVPLVVNTQGWVKGLGEDLLRAIETAAEPTHVFAFEADEPRERYEGEGWTNSPEHMPVDLPWTGPSSPPVVFTLEPAPSSPLQARYTAADMRTLSTIAYMHARLTKEPTWDFSVPLFAVSPWVVSIGPPPLSHAFLLGESADAILPSDLPLALNGGLVALLTGPDSESSEVYVPGIRPGEESSFLGLALVRAVRTDPLQLQLLTPLPAAVLATARAIAHNGALELPTPALLDFRDRPAGGVPDDGIAGTRWEDVPFFAAQSGAVGAERRRFRRNLQRRGV